MLLYRDITKGGIMSYADLSKDDQVLTAIKFIAIGSEIPLELQEELGSELVYEVSNPIKGD